MWKKPAAQKKAIPDGPPRGFVEREGGQLGGEKRQRRNWWKRENPPSEERERPRKSTGFITGLGK